MDLAGKRRPGLHTQHAQGANRVDHHTQWSDHEGLAVHALQRVTDRRAQVGAAADRFGDEHLGRHVFGEPAGRVDQRLEPAAEAPARDLLDGKPTGDGHRRVDQSNALIVGDEADAATHPIEMFGEPEDGGGLTCTQESTDHDVAGAGRARHRRGGES